MKDWHVPQGWWELIDNVHVSGAYQSVDVRVVTRTFIVTTPAEGWSVDWNGHRTLLVQGPTGHITPDMMGRVTVVIPGRDIVVDRV